MTELSTNPLWKTFLRFLLPMMLSNVLQALFGTVNNIYLGQMIGVNAIAAVTVFFPIMFFFIAFVIGLASGASVLIGQAWGAGERHKVKAIAGATMAACLALAIFIAIGGGLFARDLMIALRTPADVLDDATTYARLMMIGMPLTYIFLLMTSMLRGVSDTITPLLALIMSTAIGLMITPVLILGTFGLPKMGIASAAIASIVSSAVTLIVFAFYMRAKDHPMAPDAEFFRSIRFDGVLMRKVLRIGIPSGLGLVVISVSELVLLGLVNGYGSDATAAYGAVGQVMGYVQFPAISISITVAIFCAQTIGAGKPDRIRQIVHTGVMMNVFLTGGLTALIYLLARPIMALFIIHPDVLDMAQTLLHIVLWATLMFGLANVFSGAMRGSGTVLMPTALLAVAIFGVEVPLAFLLSHLMGLQGVWIAYATTFCAMLVLQFGFYQLVWRKRPITRLI